MSILGSLIIYEQYNFVDLEDLYNLIKNQNEWNEDNNYKFKCREGIEKEN